MRRKKPLTTRAALWTGKQAWKGVKWCIGIDTPPDFDVKPGGKPNKEQREAFYASEHWRDTARDVRGERYRLYGKLTCDKCGIDEQEAKLKYPREVPAHMCTDHVKSLLNHWDLRLDKSNLQVLCHGCNRGKGSYDYTDYRNHFSLRAHRVKAFLT